METKQIFSTFKASFTKYVKDFSYIVPLLLCMIATYGYFLTHYAVSIDDLSSDRYYFGELFAQGRFTNTFMHHLFGLIDNSQWIRDFFGLLLLALGAVVFCIVLDKHISFKSKFPKVAFSCLLVSAPIFTELFSYNGTCISIGGGFLFVATSLYFVTVGRETKNFKLFIIPSILMAVVASWYESMLVVYVEAVFALLILRSIASKDRVKFKNVFFEGLCFAVPLIIGIVAELIFQYVFVAIFNIEKSSNASKSVGWCSDEFDIAGSLKLFIGNFLCAGLWNKAIAILLISILVSVALCIYYCIKKKNLIFILLFAGLIISNFFLFVISGKLAYRMCQSFSLFTAFVVLLLLLITENFSSRFGKFAGKATCLLALYLIIVQITTCNYWYFWDYQRYHEEVNVIESVSNTLVEDYDISKPVVFTGEFTLSENIRDHSCLTTDSFGYKVIAKAEEITGVEILGEQDDKYVMSISKNIVSSYIDWGMVAFEGDNTELFKFIRFHGIDYLKQGSLEMVEEARLLATDMPQWPQQGSIVDMGEYTIVNF